MPAGLSPESLRNMMALAGLLTFPALCAFPSQATVAKHTKSLSMGSQQRGLFRFFTGFPFNALHSKATSIRCEDSPFCLMI